MRLGRSKSCLGSGGGARGRREVSSSPDSSRRRIGERRRSADRRHGGGCGESSFLKKVLSRERGRSKSPRRNSWREDIKKISSWREDRKSKSREVKIIKRPHSSKEDKVQRHQSEKRSRHILPREEVKHSRGSSFAKAKKETSVEFKKISFQRKEMSSLLPKSRSEAKESRDTLGIECEDNPLKRKLMGFGFGKREVRNKADCKDRKVDHSSLMKEDPSDDQGTVGCGDELELSISDKDVFPELRVEGSESDSIANGSIVPCAQPSDSDRINDESDKFDSLEINLDNTMSKENHTRSVKLVTEAEINNNDKKLERLGPSVASHCKAAIDNSTATVSLEEIRMNESAGLSPSLLDEQDGSALTRSLSLLELKMEVYVTRLKELEWEREQLRKDRVALQGREKSVKKELLSKLQEKEKLRLEKDVLENENKENLV